MLQEVEWSDDRSYRSGSKNEPFQFYLDALCNSTQFDLLLGYFSSAAINVLSLGFALFLYKGGKLRLVANNILSEADREAIQKAERGGIPSGILDLRDLRQLKNALDEYGQHFFECLAWLIANGRIQIKIIKPKSRMGIAHYKSGLFSDGADAVAFKASCNFTAYGLLENLEELNAFFDWEGGQLKKIVDRQQHEFEILFSGKADFVEYVDPMDILVAIKDVFGDKTLEELLIQEKKLLERKSLALENKGVKKAFDHFTSLLEALMREPRFPYPSGPREYQLTAYQNWVNNGHKGIFAMATGTGKTITSLNCLLAEYQQNRSYKAIILVPTRALVQQWKKECIKFNFKNISDILFQNYYSHF